MKKLINKILLEWSLRVYNGMPNKNNSLHLVQLRETLLSLNISQDVSDLILLNLTESEKFYARKKDGKKISVFDTKDSRDDKIKSGSHEKVDREEAEKELDKKGDKKTPVDKGSKDEPKKQGDEENPDKTQNTPTTIPNKSDDYLKSSDSDESDAEQKPTTEKITQNASDIFNNKVSGKGGGTTSLQEEIAGISRKIAIEQPNLTDEEHKEAIAQHIKDNYGDTKYGSKDQTKLIKKSASGQQTMSKIRANKNMKFSDDQPDGYPIQVTFTTGGTTGIKNELKQKLKNASPEDKAHYEKELKYFKKHATSETGTEGDGDTGMMYIDTDGRTRMIYISNKQGLGDPHANATVKSASEAIKASIQPGANVGALTSMLDDSVKGGIDANGDMVTSMRAEIDSNIEELNKAPLAKIAAKATTGSAEFVDETSTKYLDAAAKNEQVKDYIEKNELDKDNPEHIVQAVMAEAGSGKADGLNNSTKQAPNKLVFKIATATASIREKMDKAIAGKQKLKKGKPVFDKDGNAVWDNKPMSAEEAAEYVANKKSPSTKKPLMGGNMSSEDCLSIYNNKALEKLEQNVQTRKDAMQESHENMYNSMVELDVNHYMEQDPSLSSDDAIKKYDTEAGPNEQTYTASFMKRMHWDRYIDGVDDDKKMIEINDKSYSPKDFRNCLGELTGYNGEGDLKDHIKKNLRIKPGTMKLSFVSKGKTVEIGDDTWRTAGDLSKIAGGLGKDMQICLGEK